MANLSDHRFYEHWLAVVKQSRNEGVPLEPLWSPHSGTGARYFVAWCEVQYKKTLYSRFRVVRKDPLLGFVKDNCYLEELVSYLSRDDVIFMRKLAKSQPSITLQKLATMFGTSRATVSKAIRGISWKSLNAVEAPVTKQDSE